ncbi:MAG: recombinase family protein [Solobacterium sp.]|nr:recombinase family protein [Solobacterium sp.]
MYNKGKTIKEIVEYLNEKGLRNSIGNQMKPNGISKILRNKRYTGEFRYGDVVIPNGIPQIVGEDLFEDVQRKLDKNKRAPARKRAEEEYLLSTKLYCGYCGVYMNGESGTSHTSKIHRYYKCSNAKKRKSCHKKTVKKEWIEDLVVEETKNLIMDDKAIEAIVYSVLDYLDSNQNIPYYDEQLKEVQKAIDNMLNAIQQGILTSSTKQRLEELEGRKKELEDNITLDELSKPKLSEEFITFYIQQFRKLDIDNIEHRKALIDTFVNAIYLYDDKIVITFNYKDGTKTISLNDIDAALMNYNPRFDYGMLSSTMNNKTGL